MTEIYIKDLDIYLRDGCKCVYCDFDGTTFFGWRHLSIDHVIPKKLGGSDSPDNKVVACHRCNYLKSDWDPRSGAEDKTPFENAKKFT